MASQIVCQYYNFGFCKFSERCRFLHVDEECRNKECEVRSCTFRHPKIFKYFRDYNRCKFGEWCFFKHINIIENSVDKEEIAEKLENLTKLINEKDILIKDLAEKIKVLEERVLKDNSETVDDIHEDEIEMNSTFSNPYLSRKCELCDFIGKTNLGLQVHIRAKHK